MLFSTSFLSISIVWFLNMVLNQCILFSYLYVKSLMQIAFNQSLCQVFLRTLQVNFVEVYGGGEIWLKLADFWTRNRNRNRKWVKQKFTGTGNIPALILEVQRAIESDAHEFFMLFWIGATVGGFHCIHSIVSKSKIWKISDVFWRRMLQVTL